jgi:TolB protein
MDPTFSPDGSRIAYMKVRRIEALEGSQWDGVAIAYTNGTGEVIIPGSTEEGYSDPSWSPDGTRLLVSYVNNAEHSGLYLVDPGTGTVEALYSIGSHPAWNHTGTKIVFDAGTPGSETGWDIWVLDVDTRTATTLATSTYDETYPCFSPDGNQIIYTCSSNETTSTLWIVNSDGTNPHEFVSQGEGQHTVFQNGWAATGKFIYDYYTQTSGDIYMRDSDGSNVLQITDAAGYYKCVDAIISNDGSKICFASESIDTPVDYNLYIMTVE